MVSNQPKKPKTFTCVICEEEVNLQDGVACSDFEKREETDIVHSVCTFCIRGFSRAASDPSCMQPLAVGGVGLCCPDPECKNVLLMSRFLLKPQIFNT